MRPWPAWGVHLEGILTAAPNQAACLKLGGRLMRNLLCPSASMGVSISSTSSLRRCCCRLWPLCNRPIDPWVPHPPPPIMPASDGGLLRWPQIPISAPSPSGMGRPMTNGLAACEWGGSGGRPVLESLGRKLPQAAQWGNEVHLGCPEGLLESRPGRLVAAGWKWGW